MVNIFIWCCHILACAGIGILVGRGLVLGKWKRYYDQCWNGSVALGILVTLIFHFSPISNPVPAFQTGAAVVVMAAIASWFIHRKVYPPDWQMFSDKEAQTD